MLPRLTIVLVGVLAIAATASAADTFTLTTPAFESGATIPDEWSCKGKATSPVLEWTAPPKGTKSLALLVTDTDASAFTHWLGWGIKPSVRRLEEGQRLPVRGTGSTGSPDYLAPCPPSGQIHHYKFTLYALNVKSLKLKARSDRLYFIQAIRGHVVGKTALIGLWGPEANTPAPANQG